MNKLSSLFPQTRRKLGLNRIFRRLKNNGIEISSTLNHFEAFPKEELSHGQAGNLPRVVVSLLVAIVFSDSLQLKMFSNFVINEKKI